MTAANKKSALAFSSIVVAIVVSAIGLANWYATSKNAKLEALAATHEKVGRLTNSKSRLKQELASSNLTSTFEGILGVDDMPHGTALVRAKLSEYAHNADLALRSLSPTTARIDIPTETIAFRLEADAPLDHLVTLLKSIEHAPPVMLIERASLRRLQSASGEQTQPVVGFQLDVVVPVDLGEAAQ